VAIPQVLHHPVLFRDGSAVVAFGVWASRSASGPRPSDGVRGWLVASMLPIAVGGDFFVKLPIGVALMGAATVVDCSHAGKTGDEARK